MKDKRGKRYNGNKIVIFYPFVSLQDITEDILKENINWIISVGEEVVEI